MKVTAKDKLLTAAMKIVRERGYAATTVDDLCEEAQVTKGAFFHHFASKEDLAVAAANHWSSVTSQLFERAPYQKIKDPLEKILGYVEYRKELLRGKVPEFTCLVGTMLQEAYDTNPAIRDACHASIFGHASTLIDAIESAKKLYAPKAPWTAESLALHTQSVIQGAFILAKAKDDSEVAAESLVHLSRYIKLLFDKKGDHS